MVFQISIPLTRQVQLSGKLCIHAALTRQGLLLKTNRHQARKITPVLRTLTPMQFTAKKTSKKGRIDSKMRTELFQSRSNNFITETGITYPMLRTTNTSMEAKIDSNTGTGLLSPVQKGGKLPKQRNLTHYKYSAATQGLCLKSILTS